MGDLLIRNIDPELKQRLAEAAKAHKRSLSAEAEALLAQQLAAQPAKGIGTQLVELFRGLGGDDLDFEDRSLPDPPIDFGE